MASPARWAWVWASSGCWWWTREAWHSAVMELQSRHDWATELNWIIPQKAGSVSVNFCCTINHSILSLEQQTFIISYNTVDCPSNFCNCDWLREVRWPSDVSHRMGPQLRDWGDYDSWGLSPCGVSSPKGSARFVHMKTEGFPGIRQGKLQCASGFHSFHVS